MIVTDPLLVLAKSGISAGDLQGLIAWLKANPDKAAMGHSGFGGMSHVAGVLRFVAGALQNFTRRASSVGNAWVGLREPAGDSPKTRRAPLASVTSYCRISLCSASAFTWFL